MDNWLVAAGEDKDVGINGAIIKIGENHPTTINTVSAPSFGDAVKRIKAVGGELLEPKMAVPHVSYMTYRKDTESKIFGIMQTAPKAK